MFPESIWIKKKKLRLEIIFCSLFILFYSLSRVNCSCHKKGRGWERVIICSRWFMYCIHEKKKKKISYGDFFLNIVFPLAQRLMFSKERGSDVCPVQWEVSRISRARKKFAQNLNKKAIRSKFMGNRKNNFTVRTLVD